MFAERGTRRWKAGFAFVAVYALLGWNGAAQSSVPGAPPATPLRWESRTLGAGIDGPDRSGSPPSSGLGSPNTIAAQRPIPVPNTTPCSVPLFTNAEFDNYSPQTFSYSPPASCPGPWGAVVFSASFYVTQGIQYDRTGQVSIGGVNIFFGTTPEPSPSFGPSWSVERDITDYSALLTTAQPGEVDLFNIVNSQYTGIIYGSAQLLFYPPDANFPAPAVANQVLPMSTAPGGAVALSTPDQALAQTFRLPKNVERAYLDVLAQNQSDDEFFYANVPTRLAAELDSYPNTAFREVEVTIDGMPAGLAPAYPWIFTGGIDPFLWFPIPGVQTLDLQPYRIDLSPFASILSNGKAHKISIRVSHVYHYFAVTGTLLVFQDSGSSAVTGALTADTIQPAPHPPIAVHIKDGKHGPNGTVEVGNFTRYVDIEGYVNTSHGKVDTLVSQQSYFDNVQQYSDTATSSALDITQNTRLNSTVTVISTNRTVSHTHQLSYPLAVDISDVLRGGFIYQTTTISQGYQSQNATDVNGETTFTSSLQNAVAPTDTLKFTASGSFVGNSGQSSTQNYDYQDSNGNCYAQTLAAARNVLTKDVITCDQSEPSTRRSGAHKATRTLAPRIR